jgi:hypothetical protein
LVVASALTGLAFSTHYYAVFLALPLTMAIVFARREQGWTRAMRDVALAGAVTAAVFFALSPFLLVEPRTAWQDIVANRQIVMDRAVEGSGAFASAGAYLRLLWSEGLGWPVALAAVAGLALLTRDQPRTAALLAVFPLVFLAFISNTVAASRYLNPILPFIAVFAGYALSRIGGMGRLAAVLLVLPGLSQSYAVGRFFQQTDTRTLAQRYIEADVPAGSTVLLQPYSVQLVQSQASLREALVATGHDPERAPTKFALRLALDPYPAPAYRTIFLGDGGLDADKIYVSPSALGRGGDLAPLTRLGVEYVVLKRYNTEDLASAPLRAALVQRARLVAAFAPWRPEVGPESRALVTPFLHNTDTPYDRALERPGPGIEVWALGAGRQ